MSKASSHLQLSKDTQRTYQYACRRASLILFASLQQHNLSIVPYFDGNSKDLIARLVGRYRSTSSHGPSLRITLHQMVGNIMVASCREYWRKLCPFATKVRRCPPHRRNARRATQQSGEWHLFKVKLYASTVPWVFTKSRSWLQDGSTSGTMIPTL